MHGQPSEAEGANYRDRWRADRASDRHPAADERLYALVWLSARKAQCRRQTRHLWGWHRAHVSLITKGQLGFSVRNSGGNQDYVARAGSVCVFPSGFDETLFSISESKFEAIVVELDPALLETLLGDHMAASTSTLVPQIAIHDRYMALLLRAMAAEVAQGCPAGALYGHALSLALATYLDRRFSVKRRIERKRPQWVAGAKSWGMI